MTRRAVRVLASLFEQLELQLPAERGPDGEPTAAEFAASDLLDIVEAFAVMWNELPLRITGRPDYRDLITTTRLVYAVRVRGQVSPVDGAIELTDIVLDLHGPTPMAWTNLKTDPLDSRRLRQPAHTARGEAGPRDLFLTTCLVPYVSIRGLLARW